MNVDVDQFVVPLAQKLARLAAAKVDAALTAEVAVLQQELLEAARQHREFNSETGDQVANRLEAASARIGSAWDDAEEAINVKPASAGQRRAITASSHGQAVPPADVKRSRGRPRKPSEHEAVGVDDQRHALPFVAESQEVQP